MAATAPPLVQYRDEVVKLFERNRSTLRQTTTRESMAQGLQLVWNVAGSGSEAVSRNANGDIPSTPLDQTQVTLTVSENHSLKERNKFNIVTAQSNQVAEMQRATLIEVNRKIDSKIITALATGTLEVSASAVVMSKDVANIATTMLGNNNVMDDSGMIWGLLTPAAWTALSDDDTFANSQWTGEYPLVPGQPQMGDPPKRWMGVWWVKHTGLSGIATASATCFIYSQAAIGYGYVGDSIMADAQYESKQDRSWARATVYDGAVKLQNPGIIKFYHNDAAVL